MSILPPQRLETLRDRSGFTLLELVLVLVILSILATVALEAIEPQVDQTRFETTQRTIANVEDALIGTTNQRGADGSPLFTGFVADVGRLPVSRFEDTSTILTLRELWERPSTIAEFSIRPAIEDNGVPLGQEDAEILVSSGWNGPYLRLPVGSNSLQDGWGNRMVSPSPTTGYSHLRGENDVDITDELQTVYGVRSLGKNDTLNAADAGYDIDIPVALHIYSNSQVSGFVTGSITVDGSDPSKEPIVVQLYGPDPNSGLIRVDRFPKDGFTEGTNSFTFNDAAADYNVKVGPHAVRAYRDNGLTAGEIDEDDDRSPIVYFTVRPGQNTLPTLDIRPN